MIAARATTPPERFQAGYMLGDDTDGYAVDARKNCLYQLLGVTDQGTRINHHHQRAFLPTGRGPPIS